MAGVDRSVGTSPRALGPALAVALAACSGVGGEGSELPVPYDALRGGFVFATNAISGSAGYDLYWAPIPDPSQVEPVGFVRLTDSGENEWQPSISADGKGIAYAREDGIFVISRSGRIQRVSDTRDTTFRDSLPTVSPTTARVAWVREDTSQPIGETGFVETFVMLANFDGTGAEPLNPVKGTIQDAPVFDPDPSRPRIAWSEFDPTSLTPGVGPKAYGLYVFDYSAFIGTYACKTNDGFTPGADKLARPSDGRPYRCFGQHLAWPTADTVIFTQNLLEVRLDGQLSSTLPIVLDTLAAQQTGFAITEARADGFHAPFPISASYSRDARNLVVMDGLVGSLSGDQPTLAFIFAGYDGTGVFRVNVGGFSQAYDTIATHNFLLSVTTPQIVPFFE